jgi:hypothetical protein
MLVRPANGGSGRLCYNSNVGAKYLPLAPVLTPNRIDSLQSRRCEATLKFSNPAFPPVDYQFPVVDCADSQLLEITVPSEAPNGDASIVWYARTETPPLPSY